MSYLNGVRCIVTDIEGTTTSISFVVDVLFPYFRLHALEWLDDDSDSFKSILTETQHHLQSQEGISILDKQALIETLIQWSLEDRKITPLKNFQGLVWEKAYLTGEIRGHVYSDVEPNLRKWNDSGISLAVFSSGSVQAQKLIFGFSEAGDLCPYFNAYYDTQVGAKRDPATYVRIAELQKLDPHLILFLSDVPEELIAADASGFKTIQLVRPGNTPNWPHVVENFEQIT
jgi:enolase-phosphatase E1